MKSRGLEAERQRELAKLQGSKVRILGDQGLNLLLSMMVLVSVWHRDLGGMQSGSGKTT